MHKRLFSAALLCAAAIAGFVAASTAQAGEDTDATDPHPRIIIEYQRSGGFAGFNDQLRIDEQGNATLSRRGSETSFTLDPDEFADLLAILDAADFPALEPEYRAIGVVSDGFTYTIRYHCKTVGTETTAEPDALIPVIRALDGVIAATPR